MLNQKIMKFILVFVAAFFMGTYANAQTDEDKKAVNAACLGYIEGFYEGDTLKLKKSIKPELYKFGFWKNKTSGVYEHAGSMSFEQAIAFAKNVMEKKKFAKDDAPKIVEVFEVRNAIASAKVVAWWGTDYLLLSKTDGKWMIEQAIWEGPLEK